MFSFESNIPVILLINLLILLKSNVEFRTLSMINDLKFGLLLLIIITKKVNTTIVINLLSRFLKKRIFICIFMIFIIFIFFVCHTKVYSLVYSYIHKNYSIYLCLLLYGLLLVFLLWNLFSLMIQLLLYLEY